jgi:hypothetical protein
MPIFFFVRNRPGEHARQRIRAGWLGALRKNLTLWIVLVLVVTGCLVIFALLPLPSTIRAFWIGFFVAFALAGFLWTLQLLSNTHGWSVGKLGEEATAEVVLGWRQRRKGWRLVNGLLLGGYGDIDHVLVGPGGVFAIESKWTSKPYRIEQGRVAGLVGHEPVGQARDSARKVERMLRYGCQRFDVSVRPVVVLWGPGRVRVDNGWSEIDGVLVCDGPHEQLWLKQFAGEVIGPTEVEAIASVLEKQVARQVDQPIQSAGPKARSKTLNV